MYCKECGRELPADAKFCVECGSAIKQDEAADDLAESTRRVDESSGIGLSDGEDGAEGGNLEDGSGEGEATGGSKDLLPPVSNPVVAGKEMPRNDGVGKGDAATGTACKVGQMPEGASPASERAASDLQSKLGRLPRKVILAAGVIVVVLVVLVVVLSTCAGGAASSDSSADLKIVEGRNGVGVEKGCDVNIQIECESNLVFAIYDLDVSVDGNKLGTMDHGTTRDFDADLAEGKHILTVSEKGNASVDGSIDFEVTESSNLRFAVKTHESNIDVTQIPIVRAPFASADAEGWRQQDVRQQFVDAGFENVSVEEVGDLPPDQTDKVDQVHSIAINGSDQYAKTDNFYSDANVIIKYHILANIHPPMNESDAHGKNYQEVIDAFTAAGFSNIHVEAEKTADQGKDGQVTNMRICGFGFSVDDAFYPSHDVDIEYWQYDADMAAEEARLQEEREEAEKESEERRREAVLIENAKDVFEATGNYYFPYGFKCHWWIGLISEEVNPDGSVFLKVEVTVENAYGNKIKTVAEGTVVGAAVKDFHVSGLT